MYAVIQTGGKQYRVRAGDVIVVEKLEGDVGTEMSFDKVLMAGGEKGVSLGDKLKGALVHATLIETRKGEKVKVFKKIRRQGYRRTQGHRQFESVLRITGLEIGGEKAKWDGEVDLTPRSVLVARARGLAPMVEASPAEHAAEVFEAAPVPKAAKAQKPSPKAAEVEDETAMMDTPVSEQAAEAPAKKAPAKAKAEKTEAAPAEKAEAQKAEAKKAAAPKAEKAEAEPKAKAPAKAKPAKKAGE